MNEKVSLVLLSLYLFLPGRFYQLDDGSMLSAEQAPVCTEFVEGDRFSVLIEVFSYFMEIYLKILSH